MSEVLERVDRAMDFTHLNRAALVSFFAFLFFFFGCGDKQLPEQASAILVPRVESIRVAAAAGEQAAAQAGIVQLRGDIDQLRASGVLGDDDAARVLDAVSAVEARLALLPAATTTTTTAPPPAPVPENTEKGEDKGKGDKGDKDDD